MVTCPACKHPELDGELYCSECGARLGAPPPETISTGALFDTARFRDLPKVSTGIITSLQLGQIALAIAGVAQPIILQGRTEYLLGREGTETQVPDLNLNMYGARERGVSRIHAVLRLSNQQLAITDLGSTNGTRVNGGLLKPNETVRLQNGDEVRLGKLAMKISFNL
jgi:hypothetical protein